MQPRIITQPKSHFVENVLLNCHFASHLSLCRPFFSTVFGCLTVQFSINTLIYTGNATGCHSCTSTSGPSSLRLPNNDPIHPLSVCPPLLSPVSLALCVRISVCNLGELTGLHSGVMTARRTAFLSFTFARITLVSGRLPSTAC